MVDGGLGDRADHISQDRQTEAVALILGPSAGCRFAKHGGGAFIDVTTSLTNPRDNVVLSVGVPHSRHIVRPVLLRHSTEGLLRRPPDRPACVVVILCGNDDFPGDHHRSVPLTAEEVLTHAVQVGGTGCALTCRECGNDCGEEATVVHEQADILLRVCKHFVPHRLSAYPVIYTLAFTEVVEDTFGDCIGIPITVTEARGLGREELGDDRGALTLHGTIVEQILPVVSRQHIVRVAVVLQTLRSLVICILAQLVVDVISGNPHFDVVHWGIGVVEGAVLLELDRRLVVVGLYPGWQQVDAGLLAVWVGVWEVSRPVLDYLIVPF